MDTIVCVTASYQTVGSQPPRSGSSTPSCARSTRPPSSTGTAGGPASWTTCGTPFSSAFEYIDNTGTKQVITDATGPGRPHPEELVWHRLQAQGVTPQQVRRVYCELEPCTMPGHYCAVWLQATFPHAEFTHSFDYGSTAESREEGLKELITHAAQQAGDQ